MSMPLEHRLQILIDDAQHRRITALARERGVSVATFVLEAIDREIGAPAGPRAAPGRRVLEAPEMSVPDAPELIDELADLRSRRA